MITIFLFFILNVLARSSLIISLSPLIVLLTMMIMLFMSMSIFLFIMIAHKIYFYFYFYYDLTKMNVLVYFLLYQPPQTTQTNPIGLLVRQPNGFLFLFFTGGNKRKIRFCQKKQLFFKDFSTNE